MIEILLLAHMYQKPQMTCQQVIEVAETVMESPYMTPEDKENFFFNLFGNHMNMDCIKKS